MNAVEITAALGGRWHATYGMISCLCHQDRTPSLKISDRPDGDGVTLHCFAGCDWRDVKAALRRQGLLPDREAPGKHTRKFPGSEDHHHHVEHHGVERGGGDRRRVKMALEIWNRAQPIAGTIAHLYLRKRAINIQIPQSLRYIAGVEHRPTALKLPALIAAVQAPNREITAIVRTYLRTDGRGKAQVNTPRMALGRIGAGAVRLAAAAPTLGLAEGIETALSAMQATGVPTWAAVGSRLEAVELPELVEHVIIFGDRDEPGRVAARKAETVFRRQGRKVTIRFPDRGEDWNGALAGVEQ